MLVWLRLEGLRVARCHLRDPLWFNGCSWKRPSRATSSPTSPCATSRSTAHIPGTISSAWPGQRVRVFHKGQSQPKRTLHGRTLFESLTRRPLTEARLAPNDAALAEVAAGVERAAWRRLGRSLASAKRMSAPATVANWKPMLSTMPSTTSSALDCASSPRRAMPTFYSLPARSPATCARRWSALPGDAGPKVGVAVRDCAVAGGIFADSYAVAGGVNTVVPVDLHISGCPPTPRQLLEGLLALLETQCLT
jgi:NADH ubiquinone oxidoreductase, 20 Kd subunit